MQNNENVYYLYQHTNLINGKIYIGQTRQKPTTRWGSNGSGYKHNKVFYADIQKYGWDNFKHEILGEKLTKKQVDYMERRFIAFLNLQNKEIGYNIAPGGNLRILTPEAREKIRQSKMGHTVSEETRKKISLAKKGTTHTTSEETREKIRQKMLGRIISKETKKKISEAKKGKVPWNKGKTNIYSEETLKKISEKKKGQIPPNKGIKMSKEQYEKCKNTMFQKGTVPWNKGLSMSEETREKLIQSLKKHPSKGFTGGHHSEGTKEKARQRMLGKKMSEETRKKMSEAHKRRWLKNKEVR